jgi:hypothetical protein
MPVNRLARTGAPRGAPTEKRLVAHATSLFLQHSQAFQQYLQANQDEDDAADTFGLIFIARPEETADFDASCRE